MAVVRRLILKDRDRIERNRRCSLWMVLASTKEVFGTSYMTLEIVESDNLRAMRRMPNSSFSLIFADVPYNTGSMQKIHSNSYSDTFDDYIGWIKKRLKQCHRLLKANGSLFIQLDYREVHYVKIELDKIFGRENFRNEIIWAYDYGARSKKRWSTKHDTILWYTRGSEYTFNYAAIDRVPYMAPKLVGRDKAAIGKTPTDVWWNTIVHTTGKERVHYPTQKPLKILQRIVAVHSNKNDRCLDFCAGSGSFGEACASLNRSATLIDNNPQAIAVMRKRLKRYTK